MPHPEARLIVEVRPRAGRDAIAGWRGGALQVRVAAPPADGAANEAVRALLADRLGCARSRVEILRGHTARTKAVRVAGLSAPEVLARLGGPGADGSASGEVEAGDRDDRPGTRSEQTSPPPSVRSRGRRRPG